MKRLFLIIVSIICILSLLTGCTANDAWQDDFYTTGTIYSWNGTAFVPLGTGGGGTNDHSALINLDYASAGHTGFEPAILYPGNPAQYLDGTGNFSIPAGGGGGNVTASANLGDNTVIRGDGGALGVQDSGVTIDDFDNLNTNGGDIDGFDINAGNDINVTNDLDVTDNADIGGQLVVTGNISAQGNYVLTTDNVNDVPSNGNTTEPISSNWAYDHINEYATGSTFPASPWTGEMFLHSVTGRKILYSYSGSAWQPIISIGSMTVYVDSTDGTNDTSHGTGVDASAFKTVQYAVDTIPGLVGGNVSIYINGETYAETVTIRGKVFTADYNITIYGTLSLHDNITFDGNGVKGATTSQSSVHEHGMTTNHYQHQLLKFTNGSNNGLYRPIDSNSNDAGTANIVLCGTTLTAQPLTNDTATIYDFGTIITTVNVYGVPDVRIYDIKFSTQSTVWGYGKLNLYRCYTPSGYSQQYAQLGIYECVCIASGTILASYNFSSIQVRGSKIYDPSDVAWACRIDSYSRAGFIGGNVIENGSYGIITRARGMSDFWAPDVYNFIKNSTVGNYAELGGMGLSTTYVSYSGCGTNESAVAASYSYID